MHRAILNFCDVKTATVHVICNDDYDYDYDDDYDENDYENDDGDGDDNDVLNLCKHKIFLRRFL